MELWQLRPMGARLVRQRGRDFVPGATAVRSWPNSAIRFDLDLVLQVTAVERIPIFVECIRGRGESVAN